jgi:hypothetical protein
MTIARYAWLVFACCGGATAAPSSPQPTASSATYTPGTICGVPWPPKKASADTCTVLHDPLDLPEHQGPCPDHRAALASFGEPLTEEQSALLDALAVELRQLEHLSLLRIAINPSADEPAQVTMARAQAIATLLVHRGIASARLDVFVGGPPSRLGEPSRVTFIPAACDGVPIAPKS